MPDHAPPANGGRVRSAIVAAAARFAFSETARLDAELLMAHALGVSREALLLRHLDDPIPDGFAALVARRAAHEPIAYITGTRAFWTIDLAVGPGVLIPRADSETLIEAAVDRFGDRAPARILDLGTGPGTLLLAALDQWPAATGLGIDASDAALACARDNAMRLGMTDRVAIRRGDWAAGVAERFDLVLGNPPYIGTSELLPDEVRAHEPAAALFAGRDGLDAYRIIAPQLPALLAPRGVAIVEIGATQAEAVTALLTAQGLTVALRHDLGGRPRALVAA
ncbi:peptide chain release factor N(5)-glutamine methyltransferase [Sphingomonas sp. AR_OL41]|uniref:peptide chain release factor N(5)-glutamine methyltransferase n=1 Tax=Sphingomonas sp. AR_OL41 TaxID=3042729 RepID=UPI00247FC35E|nr:peptide chain release factor N(5)-glutamine methyltransferase [Sphingomonas sp. AR_OL41]MDH7973745.1 peptide chain release factor N(5)-glutamine methyltransferase [Sphingomonas sp. AR_OL41]